MGPSGAEGHEHPEQRIVAPLSARACTHETNPISRLTGLNKPPNLQPMNTTPMNDIIIELASCICASTDFNLIDSVDFIDGLWFVKHLDKIEAVLQNVAPRIFPPKIFPGG